MEHVARKRWVSTPEQKKLLRGVNEAINHRDETYAKNDDDVWKRVEKAREAGIPDAAICRDTGLNRTTLQRRLGYREDEHPAG